MSKKHKKSETPAADNKPVEFQKTKSKTREYIESLIIAAIIAFFVRSFFIQAFKIPSSSMEPTLLVGDHLLVNRLSYVVKVPFTDIVLFEPGKPDRGDVIVFRYPVDRSKDFIKRVIAREGDTVEIKDKNYPCKREKDAGSMGILFKGVCHTGLSLSQRQFTAREGAQGFLFRHGR